MLRLKDRLRQFRRFGRDYVPEHPFFYSMVVDDHPFHPYQAETLLFTLEEYAAVPRNRMVVQCTDRVADSVRSELARNGYSVVVIPPYLDGKYCNKIGQLDYFLERKLEGARGVFLLDLDFVVLAPLKIPDRDCVWGKIVDDTNPPLAVLKRIFSETGVNIPGIVPTDWGTGETVATNLNGGFLYLPLRFTRYMQRAWRHWGEFLYARPELFERPWQRNNTDQIAFALALADSKIPFRYLTANWNFPVHRPNLPQSFEPEMPVRGLHYHQCLDTFGLIERVFNSSSVIEAAVERANDAIGARDAIPFFDRYKHHLAQKVIESVPAATKPLFSESFVTRSMVGDRKRKLVLHAGTSKTGTTSLQWHLETHREKLVEHGFWYPTPTVYNKYGPKHQRLVETLWRGEEDAFEKYVEEALREMPADTHTIIFTAEGIFNHWWDFTPRARGWLRQLASHFDFELCVWFRDPESYAAAQYVQCLRNPPIDGATRNVYGRDIDCIDALKDEWFRRHLDYLGFYYEAQQLFGAEHVKAFPFTNDTVREFTAHYGLGFLPENPKRWNATLRHPTVAVMRMLNRHRFAMGPAERKRIEEFIEEFNGFVGEQAEGFRFSDAERALVAKFARRGWCITKGNIQAACVTK